MVEKITYDEMLSIVEEVQEKLTDLNIQLNELIDEGASRIEGKAQKLYLDIYGLNNKLLNAPNENVRKISLEFAEKHDLFTEHQLTELRDLVMDFNDKLGNVDLTDESPFKIKLPSVYETQDDLETYIVSPAEDEDIYLNKENFNIITIRPYKEKEYTLEDGQILLGNNYGYTGLKNKYVFRVIKQAYNKLLLCKMELCLTVGEEAFEIVGEFKGTEEKEEDVVKEIEEVLKYIIENN